MHGSIGQESWERIDSPDNDLSAWWMTMMLRGHAQRHQFARPHPHQGTRRLR